MKKQPTFNEAQEPDTVFGAGTFTEQDIAARRQFIAESRKKQSNIAAVEAVKLSSVKTVTTVAQKPTERKLAQSIA